MLYRSHLLIAIAVGAIGCGRIGFDPSETAGDGGPPPIMEVVQTATDLTVTVQGRFKLVFGESRDWFAIGWRDATSDDEELVADLPDLDKTVLQGVMFEVPGSDFQGTAAGTNRMLDVLVNDGVRVVFRSRFQVPFGADTVQVVVTNDLDRDGVWAITADFDRVVGTTLIETLEVADSHVNPALAWTQTTSNGNYSWRRDGAGLRATLRVTAPPTSDQNPRTDETNNLYFSESTLTMPVTRAWSCVVWPPT